ncbi:hypothetical protein EVAR_95275_1 [Eumeta japonica]|uniref:Uncharacterized protein n=1 Tax=Eumeta variegata TaxID=151549 RepID=A0A4C1UJY6_EUMVA|nr:hypothetical protein EVAR_95275_1 [Eumeta japonica]
MHYVTPGNRIAARAHRAPFSWHHTNWNLELYRDWKRYGKQKREPGSESKLKMGPYSKYRIRVSDRNSIKSVNGTEIKNRPEPELEAGKRQGHIPRPSSNSSESKWSPQPMDTRNPRSHQCTAGLLEGYWVFNRGAFGMMYRERKMGHRNCHSLDKNNSGSCYGATKLRLTLTSSSETLRFGGTEIQLPPNSLKTFPSDYLPLEKITKNPLFGFLL